MRDIVSCNLVETTLIRISFAACLIVTPAIAATYSPTEAQKHVGESATVEGIASVYVAKSGTTFVDLGGSGRDAPFTGVIFKDKAATMPSVQSYSGKVVDITGTIKDYQGKAEIVIEDAGQIKAK
jgi:hypothetical protein